MNRCYITYIICVISFLFSINLFTLNANSNAKKIVPYGTGRTEEPDTVQTHFPVAKTSPNEYEDLKKENPVDLKNPDNIKTTIEYDVKTNRYILRTKVGDLDIATPMTLTPEEYQDYSLKRSIQAYYREKYAKEYEEETNKKFSLTDMQFDIGPADRIFGPGGVKIKTQGTAEVTLGLKTSNTKNPSLPERSRKRTYFNFDESVQLNMQASVGTKVNFDMNYNTETAFDFDSKKLKLGYTGDEDEIIKSLEAGNVSMTTSNSLINGGAALFGIKADLQFGKLRVNALFAQQESESKTVSSKGGVQTQSFELKIDEYDENRHFFLSQYFRDIYDQALSKLPYVSSGIYITKVEVWITNKRSNYDQARNIVAFSDLGEHKHIHNPQFTPNGSSDLPRNEANTLYRTVVDNYPDTREISRVTQALNGFIEGGTDFEKIESARKLESSEYTVNQKLGYISLKAKLQSDEVLSVAFEYTSGGQTYQVGEFSSDNSTNTNQCIYTKLLKGTTMSPGMPFWDLMMKNVYSLGAYSIQKEKFQLNIQYQSDTTGVYLNYIPEGNIAKQLLIRVMNLDRINSKEQTNPDGFFDFVEGMTISSSDGRIFFPVVEPFGSYLREKIGNDAIADKYVFQELYDSTLTYARQIAEKNKFILTGEFKASSGAEIQLGATNVARGSVKVTAGGATLTENVDYTVDYAAGIVTILNESIVSSGTPISVSLENQSMFSTQRKTMFGLDLNYALNEKINFGATIMHMSEKPLTTKTAFGEESVKNTLWGFNTSYKSESQWLTNMVDKLPLLTLTKPSQISFNAEFAHLIAGHYENRYSGQYSYLDDFETTQNGYDLLNPYPWTLASVPYDDASTALFPEASLVNDIEYGKNRALLAWYYIDGLFTRRNSSSRPSYMTPDDYSDHYVRAVYSEELFPGRDLSYNESNTLSILNLAYYPNERGPYNLDADGMNPDGTLVNPEKRWGGMMRRIEQSDFETANIEYIEFWLMDPFIKNPNAEGGDLYFNLGEISEDILKDEKKFFENGLPIDGDLSKIDSTVWGKVPRQQSTVYAFDNTAGARELQDVGLNGLSAEEEKTFPTYAEYLDKLRGKLTGETLAQMEADPFSPFNSPGGDLFKYFRNSYYDEIEADILTRYKHYNGTEGNSTASDNSNGSSNSSAKTVPDVEDLNQDNTLNENEKYYEYKVSLRPKDMVVGNNFIADIREATPLLANGNKSDVVKWYLFKIPVKEYQRSVGAIRDFKTIRFMRVYMTGFKETTILRFGTFELVRGEWRTYTNDLSNPTTPPTINGTLEVSSVNIEENTERTPVNYVIPPGVSRAIDPGQPTLVQQNEQALSLKVTNLASQDARAVYKNTSYDLRRYKRLQLFTHAEAFEDGAENATALNDGDISVFIRLGSDYKNNYYEYEVPLTLTPKGVYNNNVESDRELVWPTNNMLDFRLEILTNLKLARNKDKRAGANGVTYQTVYSALDPDNSRNTISIVGNPSLAEVKTIMIGIRNNSKDIQSGEVWVNELRLTDFDEEGGWAANANLNIALSDLGSVSLSGRIETAGFGALDQSVNERRLDDYSQFNIATSIEMGKFFPEKAKVSIPLYYAYTKETTTPQYDPLNQDIKLKDALDAVETKAERDSIKDYSIERITTKSIAFNNVKVDIKSKNPMPYDPANFSLSYSYSENNIKNPETVYETTKDYSGNFTYNYTPYAKPFRPFKNVKSNGYTKYLKQLGINYLPSNINFQTSITRNYYEQKLRDLNAMQSGTEDTGLLSFSQEFYWNRAFSLRWDFTNALKMTFTSGTNARIEEPYMQVNKELNPDQYQVWKDSVKQSIKDLGTPMKYDQSFIATWNMPLQYIPALDWINSSISYNASYNWDRGASIDEELELGNTIKNQRQIDWQGAFNLQNLYNKNSYLKEVNRKFSTTRRTVKTKEKKPFGRSIKLNMDSGVIVRHSLASKKLSVKARTSSGRNYTVKYEVLDANRIRITNKDTAKIRLTIAPAPNQDNDFWKKSLEHATRFLMMVRRINVQYSTTDGMMIPGFRPEIGDIFGQTRSSIGMAPGLAFAFGSVRRDYIDEYAENGWLVIDENNDNPAMINNAKNLTIRAELEPIAGLKITLNANRVDTKSTEIHYAENPASMWESQGGNFTMTTIALGSAFGGSGNAANGYRSDAFDKFLSYRNTIVNRLENLYSQTVYPSGGFMEGSSLAGQPYNPQLTGGISSNSPDVLIPAFLAAYTGKNPNKIALSAFPSIASLLPNWRVTYDGLIRIPILKKHFKNITLTHQYRCTYSVGAFSSFLNWVDAGQDGLGYVRDVLTGNPSPSSPYDISAVSITENFSPLFGVDGTLLNNVTLKAEYNTSRNLNLNISSYQLVEGLSNEMVIGIGYKLTEFNKILGIKKKGTFSNDLDIRLDFSYRKMQSLIRKIETAETQATSGNIAKTIQFSADYALSKALTLRAFYDLQINTPLVSSASYPTSNSNYGISLQFMLTR